MTQPLLPEPFANISDGWAISHILLYAILGYFFPTCILPLFIIGVIWECMEESYGWIIRNTQYKNVSCHLQMSDMSSWWFGRWHDVISNSIGLGLGYSLYSLTHK